MGKQTLKHLTASMARRATNKAYGSCFHRATAMVLDVPGTELCIGTFAGANDAELLSNPNGSPTDFIHAWVERGNEVWAPSLLSQSNDFFGPIDRATYYEENSAKDIKRLSRSEVLVLSGEYGLSAHLRKDTSVKSGKRLSQVMLDASGVEYRVEDGGVFPAGA